MSEWCHKNTLTLLVLQVHIRGGLIAYTLKGLWRQRINPLPIRKPKGKGLTNRKPFFPKDCTYFKNESGLLENIKHPTVQKCSPSGRKQTETSQIVESYKQTCSHSNHAIFFFLKKSVEFSHIQLHFSFFFLSSDFLCLDQPTLLLVFCCFYQ